MALKAYKPHPVVEKWCMEVYGMCSGRNPDLYAIRHRNAMHLELIKSTLGPVEAARAQRTIVNLIRR